jgi:hypothetical protein
MRVDNLRCDYKNNARTGTAHGIQLIDDVLESQLSYNIYNTTIF